MDELHGVAKAWTIRHGCGGLVPLGASTSSRRTQRDARCADKQQCNFGNAAPEGYRKALRAFNSRKFDLPL